MKRILHILLLIILFVLLSCFTCLGQMTYYKLKPGESTKREVEQFLGQPMKKVSETLIEYKSRDDAPWRLYVQYRDSSPSAIVDRIERTCSKGRTDTTCLTAVNELNIQLKGVLRDFFSETSKPQGLVSVEHYGVPRYIVMTQISKSAGYETRLAIYSKDLYESSVPSGGCTGTIFGVWQTDRGIMQVGRVGDDGIEGTYPKNRGSISLHQARGGYIGGWRDNTGKGTMALLLDKDTFSATWTGATASVVSNETRKPSITNERDAISAKLTAMIAAGGSSAATGPIITESSEPSLRIAGLPAGEPWKGKCVR